MNNRVDNFEHRKMMWSTLSKLFAEQPMLTFVWMFSSEDRETASMLPDGMMPGIRGMSKQYTLAGAGAGGGDAR